MRSTKSNCNYNSLFNVFRQPVLWLEFWIRICLMSSGLNNYLKNFSLSMVLRSTWAPFTAILLNEVIPATFRRFHPFDSRQDVTERAGSHPLICTKTAMKLKTKTEVNFKSGNLVVRARYVDDPLFGYTVTRNSLILFHNRISAKITSEISHFMKR